MLQDYLNTTERLLRELHDNMTLGWFADLPSEKPTDGFNPFDSGGALREPIFYSGESAYGFQYRDCSARKYAADAPWMLHNKGFAIRDACQVLNAICELQMIKVPLIHRGFADLHPDEWTLLPGFEFSIPELASESGIDSSVISMVVDAFAVPTGETNAGFMAVGDFNVAAAYPLIRTRTGTFLLLQQYSALEALYDAPFY